MTVDGDFASVATQLLAFGLPPQHEPAECGHPAAG
jgi:hypothetical protein